MGNGAGFGAALAVRGFASSAWVPLAASSRVCMGDASFWTKSASDKGRINCTQG